MTIRYSSFHRFRVSREVSNGCAWKRCDHAAESSQRSSDEIDMDNWTSDDHGLPDHWERSPWCWCQEHQIRLVTVDSAQRQQLSARVSSKRWASDCGFYRGDRSRLSFHRGSSTSRVLLLALPASKGEGKGDCVGAVGKQACQYLFTSYCKLSYRSIFVIVRG
jgi:hypothetical protein